MFVIVLNQTNLVQDGQNNKLVYKFPNSVLFKDKYIAVSNVSMFYSWFNITASSQNNYFTYTFPVGGTLNTYTVRIPDGIYEIVDINNLIQFTCIQNNTYYINSAGNYVYPFEFQVNPNRYAVQINTYYLYNNTTLPAGYTLPDPVGTPISTLARQNSIVTIPANFNIIVGYTAGFATAQNLSGSFVPSGPYVSKTPDNTISYISTTSPQVQPNNNVLFSISNINNPYSQPSSIIYSLNPSVAIGEQIYETPPNFMWNKLIDGTYNELRLTLLGTDLRPLQINDPNMTILLAIRDASEGFLAAK